MLLAIVRPMALVWHQRKGAKAEEHCAVLSTQTMEGPRPRPDVW
jgi:hypothetical protein